MWHSVRYMVGTVVVLAAWSVCGCFGVSVLAKSSKSLSLSSPDGAKKMFVEHSSVSDLDSSASGYIYRSDGKSPATVVHLGEADYKEPEEFGQAMNYGAGSAVAQPSEKYEKGSGSAGEEGYYSNSGEKGDKGYNSYNDFHQGLLKKFLKDQNSGFYNQAAGGKQGHHAEGGSYAGFGAAKKGENGGSFQEEKSHKKGHKTTGFHNVYHKDEYKKQHSFYDEADNSGHFDKYGKGAQHYGAQHGGYKHGGHSGSGYQASDYGKKGGFDQGSFSGAAKGYEGAEGGNSHFANNAEYGNKGGNSFQKDFGFGSSDGFGFGH